MLLDQSTNPDVSVSFPTIKHLKLVISFGIYCDELSSGLYIEAAPGLLYQVSNVVILRPLF